MLRREHEVPAPASFAMRAHSRAKPGFGLNSGMRLRRTNRCRPSRDPGSTPSRRWSRPACRPRSLRDRSTDPSARTSRSGLHATSPYARRAGRCLVRDSSDDHAAGGQQHHPLRHQHPSRHTRSSPRPRSPVDPAETIAHGALTRPPVHRRSFTVHRSIPRNWESGCWSAGTEVPAPHCHPAAYRLPANRPAPSAQRPAPSAQRPAPQKETTP